MKKSGKTASTHIIYKVAQSAGSSHKAGDKGFYGVEELGIFITGDTQLRNNNLAKHE